MHDLPLFMSTEMVEIDVFVDLRIPFFSAPSNILDLIRTAIENEIFPVELSDLINVLEVEFTTGKCFGFT